MATKMVSRSVQFHPEVWKFLQNEAERRDESTASFVRECVEDYIHTILANEFFDITVNVFKKRNPNYDEDFIKRPELAKLIKGKSVIELAKYANQTNEENQGKNPKKLNSLIYELIEFDESATKEPKEGADSE